MRTLAADALEIWNQSGRPAALSTPHAVVTFRGAGGAVGSRDRLTHLMHWYPAKMFYRIPDQILQSVQPHPSAVILDPFCGSGTVLLEAITRGHQAIGIDIHPLAQLISRVKTTPLNEDRIAPTASHILRFAQSLRCTPREEQLPPYWFLNGPRLALHRLRRAIDTIESNPYREFFLVCLTSIVRRCSLADPSIPPPVRMNATRATVAGARYRRHFELASQLDAPGTFARFATAVAANAERLATLKKTHTLGAARIIDASASQTTLASNSIDLVITSPPYCGAQKYVRNFQLELRLLDFSPAAIADIDQRTLGTERSRRQSTSARLLPDAEDLIARIHHRNAFRANMLRDYLAGLTSFAIELRRVMKAGANAFVTFGVSRIAGIDVDLAKLYASIAEAANLTIVAILEDNIPTRGMITRRHRTAGTIAQEYVLWTKPA